MAVFPLPTFCSFDLLEIWGWEWHTFCSFESVYSRLSLLLSWVILVEKEQKVGCCVGENKRYKKSEKYKGVYQRKDGTWFYRIKITLGAGEKPTYIQQGGFDSEEVAHRNRLLRLNIELYSADRWNGDAKSTAIDNSFSTVFSSFLADCESSSSQKKYQALYNAHLKRWSSKDIADIQDGDIDILLLGLSLKGYSESYISSTRKLVKKFFQYAHHIGKCNGGIAQTLSSKNYQLRVLTLFSGIGAPEQALKNIEQKRGITFPTVGYCEEDNRTSWAYSLLHNINMDNDLVDVMEMDREACKHNLSGYDLMIFGSPCQDVSNAGERAGLLEEGKSHPSYIDLLYDRVDGLTRSGLFYRALQIALWTQPKFIIFENVAQFLKYDFEIISQKIEEVGYKLYYRTYNSRNFNVPQNRSRVFFVMIRKDIPITFDFPDPPINKDTAPIDIIKAEDWYEKNVSDEYYLTEKQVLKAKERIANKKSYAPNFRRTYISCLTTNAGKNDPYVRQTLVEDEKGVRCLSSEELMRFQGFPMEYGTLLRENGFTNEEIGKLVGNSITVPVIQAILEKLIDTIIEE